MKLGTTSTAGDGKLWQNIMIDRGEEISQCVGICFSFFPFDIIFGKNWLNAPTGTRTHGSWSLVKRDNPYTIGTRHAGNIASLEV